MSTNISWWAQSSVTGPNLSTLHTSTMMNGSGFYFNTSGNAIIWGNVVSWDTDSPQITANVEGRIQGSAFFWINDSLTPTEVPGRRGCWVYALDPQSRTNSSMFHIWERQCVLSYQPDNISTWYDKSFTISGLEPGKPYIIGVGRYDAWTDDWQVTAAWYNMNVTGADPARFTGEQTLVNLYDSNQSYMHIGAIEDLDYEESCETPLWIPELGTQLQSPKYSTKLARVRLVYAPQVGNLSWVCGYILNQSVTPYTARNIRIYNRSDENQEVIDAVPIVSEFMFERTSPLIVRETYLGVNMTNNATFSSGSMIQDSSQAIFNSDVNQLTVGDINLTELWREFQFGISYVPAIAMAGNLLGVGGVGHGGGLFSGHIEVSNISSLIPYQGATKQIKIKINNLPNLYLKGAVFETMRLVDAETQRCVIDFVAAPIAPEGTFQLGQNLSDDWWYATADLAGGGSWYTAQTFTPTTSFELTAAKIKVFRDELFSPDPTLIVQVQETNGSNLPNGVVLASGSTNANNFTTQLTGSWITVNMSAVTLQQSTVYALVLTPNDWDSFDYYDDGRYVGWRSTLSIEAYPGGIIDQSPDYGTTWSTNISTRDLMFEIWGF